MPDANADAVESSDADPGPADDAGAEDDEEGLWEYVAREFKKDWKVNLAYLIFFLMFAGFLVGWWLFVVLNREPLG
ncbi:MAG: hypothetical protein ACLFMT_01890 [Halobacteriales archaeon]